MQADSTPLLLARITKLTKQEGHQGPDVIWVAEALPGRVSAAGANMKEALHNFRLTIEALGRRLDAEGIDREQWLREEEDALSTADRALLRRQRFYLKTRVHSAGGFVYVQHEKIRHQLASSAA